jgi:hypothetical protein
MSELVHILAKLFSAALTIFGVVWTGIAVYLARRSRRSELWLQTTGTVLTAEVRKTTDSHGSVGIRVGYTTTYEPHIRYAYSVGGRSFENDTYALAVQTSIPEAAGAEAIVREYSVGYSVVVFYDPDSPEDSALVRGGSKGNTFFLAIGFVCIVSGILGMLLG